MAISAMSFEKNTQHDTQHTNLPIYRRNGRSLGIIFSNLAVHGSASSRATILDLPEMLYRTVQTLLIAPMHRLTGNRKRPTKRILRDVSGVIFPGETLLVLGRPGAGCSTALRALGNNREPFAAVKGEVRYASIGAEDMARRYGAEVVYCGEDDVHYANLSVKHTTQFGLRLCGGQHQEGVGEEHAQGQKEKEDFVDDMTSKLLDAFGIAHTANTVVGDSFIRGVSGGERRRVSLAESLASNPAVACWDNPIRGLDSAAALKFLRMLKQLSRATGMANVATLYQASESMYAECFDRVMVLYEGRMVFCGRAAEAKQYFINLGFFCHPRLTTPEFLAAVTSPVERVVREGYQGRTPLSPDAMAAAFRESAAYKRLQADMADYETRIASNPSHVTAFIAEHARLRAKGVLPNSRQSSALWTQTAQVTLRHFHLIWRDRRSHITGLALSTVTALINGSAFYMSPATSTGSFMKGGGLFFTLIYFLLAALPHVSATITARPLLAKQMRLGFLHPAASVLGQTVADVPLAVLEVLLFALPYYFMLGLSSSAAGGFWTFVAVLAVFYNAALALFRALGAWAPGSSTGLLAAGAALPVALQYSGYAPPLPTMLGWARPWLRRISPSPYALEALLANEFGRIALGCTDEQLVPSGAGYDGSAGYQGCPLPGVAKGERSVEGGEYLRTYFGYDEGHLWRNFGIVVAFWAIYAMLAAVGLTVMVGVGGSEGGLAFKRGAESTVGVDGDGDDEGEGGHSKSAVDVEKHAASGAATASPAKHLAESPSASVRGSPQDSECEKDDSDDDGQQDGDQPGVVAPSAAAATFTFEKVAYTINANGKEKRLLDGVSGFVRPGQLTALMGASGAGKTTLLDTLAQRNIGTGAIDGEVLLNGRPLTGAFGRACGFCMQQDVHEPHATVREALQFSAIMRQPQHVPETEKKAYVEEVIELLELGPIADALVGKPGEGSLGVEERKRVTIGVELAARPSALLFLDEPTSGLDSQAAFSIVLFLQKIAAQGIPVLCTIHQPSGILFDMFDHVLLLAPGGKTLYFGQTGRDCRTVVDYFARHGAVIGEHENPAEFIITTATASSGQGDRPKLDWASTWSASPEAAAVQAKIAELKQTSWSDKDDDNIKNADAAAAFALPLTQQIIQVTKRHWLSVWRDGPYNFSKLFKGIFTELFVAFGFFHADASLQGTQNHALFFLLFSWIVPAIMPDIQASWFAAFAIFDARERNGVYARPALVAALVLVELPWQCLNLAVVFLCTYWTLGFPATAAQAGYELLMYVLYGAFGSGFAQLIAALFPSERLAGFANSLSWVVLTAFTGAAIPHAQMNRFYRPWLFWADPLRYIVSGSAANVLHGVEVRCAERDLTVFDPPPGSTCGEWMRGWFEGGNPGYLVDEAARVGCGYCGYKSGDEYTASLDFGWEKRWRDLGVFVVFAVSNVALVFAVEGLRERGWAKGLARWRKS